MNALDETLAALDARMGRKTAQAVHRVFGPPKPAAATKGDLTTQAAKEIIAAETQARADTTARLRALRLAKSAEEAAPPADAAPAPRGARSKKRSR